MAKSNHGNLVSTNHPALTRNYFRDSVENCSKISMDILRRLLQFVTFTGLLIISKSVPVVHAFTRVTAGAVFTNLVTSTVIYIAFVIILKEWNQKMLINVASWTKKKQRWPWSFRMLRNKIDFRVLIIDIYLTKLFTWLLNYYYVYY